VRRSLVEREKGKANPIVEGVKRSWEGISQGVAWGTSSANSKKIYRDRNQDKEQEACMTE